MIIRCFFIIYSLGISVFAAEGINVHYFKPPANAVFVFTETADIYSPNLEHSSRLKPGLFSAYYDYVANPLIQVDNAGNRDISLVKDIHTIQASFLYQFSSRLSTFLNLPIHKVNLDESVNPSSGQKILVGELTAFAKYKMTRKDEKVQFAIIPEILFSFGESGAQYFVSSSSPSLGAKLAINTSLSKVWYAGAHIGVRFSPDHKFREADYSYLLPVSLGLSRTITSHLSFTFELSTALSFSGENNQNVFQIGLGPRFNLGDDLIGTLNVGTGRLTSDSAIDYRIIAGINMPFKFSFGEAKVKPEPPEQVVKYIYRKDWEISFQKSSYRIDSTGKNQLHSVALKWKRLKRIKHNKKIIISAFASLDGGYEFNQAISKKRASEIKAYLVGLGIPKSKIISLALGEVSRQDIGIIDSNLKDLLNQYARVSIE